jgi:hypothetical protein
MSTLSNYHCIFLNVGSRAGVAQYMKTEWRVVAIFNVVLFAVLVRHMINSFTILIISSILLSTLY